MPPLAELKRTWHKHGIVQQALGGLSFLFVVPCAEACKAPVEGRDHLHKPGEP